MKKLLCLLFAFASGAASAEIVIGVSVSATGPGASLGVHVGNAINILPKTIGGESVRFVQLDDASDPTVGVRNVRRFATEDKVDMIIGSSSVPVAIAQAAVANEARIPFVALCPIAIDPVKQSYIFAVPQPIPLMIEAVLEHMQANKVKNSGFIGFSDPWGDLTYGNLRGGGTAKGINVTTNERYARTDTSVTAQMLKVMASSPDVIFVGASGTPAALPQIASAERGYKGQMYHTHGVVNRDFIRVGGKSAEGVIAPTGAVVVAEQLPADHPLKTVGIEFLKFYEGTYGTGSRNAFAAYAYDAGQIIKAAVPVALKTAKPGNPAFRQAMRDAIESNKEVKGTHAVYSMSPTDHYGVDKRARVLVRVENGEWQLVR